MAEVMAVGRHRATGETEDMHDAPIMPHRMHCAKELDELYPSLEAVDDPEGGEEPEQDPLLAHGLSIAEGIAQDASICGRRGIKER